jgi:ribosomal protein L11 methyltransferase
VSLEIDAGTAFGTGHHATTAGCLSLMDRLFKTKTPRRVLDFGCGTGVLAIAAARKLRGPVVAIDIDPEAVRVAGANAWRNGVGPLVRVQQGADPGRDSYHLVVANILAGPLIRLAPRFAGALRPGGTLVLSGLVRGQQRAVLAAYRNRGLVLEARRIEQQWVTLALRRP